jgi:hypothetical protein
MSSASHTRISIRISSSTRLWFANTMYAARPPASAATARYYLEIEISLGVDWIAGIGLRWMHASIDYRGGTRYLAPLRPLKVAFRRRRGISPLSLNSSERRSPASTRMHPRTQPCPCNLRSRSFLPFQLSFRSSNGGTAIPLVPVLENANCLSEFDNSLSPRWKIHEAIWLVIIEYRRELHMREESWRLKTSTEFRSKRVTFSSSQRHHLWRESDRAM